MAVRYRRLDGELLSVAWYRVLVRARKNGVPFSITDGKRTMYQQLVLWRLWKAGRGNLAAFPSPTAPHIRVGRADHAIDFGPNARAVDRVVHYLNSRGLRARRPVPGEWWHVEVDGRALKNLARRIGPV